MTREERIRLIKHLKYSHSIGADYTLVDKDVDKIIEALEQEHCEDCISRDELLKAIDTWDKFGCDADTKLVPYQDHYIPYIHYDDVVKYIKGMPSVTPQPKTGHWILTDDDFVYCSECEDSYYQRPIDASWYYCPNCGAKMTESEDEEK